MQLKFITLSIAAFAVGNGLAGPLPVEDAAIEAHGEQYDDIQLQAAQYAATHADDAVDVQQYKQLNKYWPNYRFGRRSAWTGLYFVNNCREWLRPSQRINYWFLNSFDWLDTYNDQDFNSWDDYDCAGAWNDRC